jgi:DNA-directed RNA polymerase specialized sigma24 family protein
LVDALGEAVSYDDLVTDCRDEVVYAARPVVARYRQWTDRDDVMQEMWLWIFENSGLVRDLLAEGRSGILRLHLRRVGEAWGRREKAAREGYSPKDEFFYNAALIREMLPNALDPKALPAQGDNEVKVRGASTSDGYGNWAACLVDVRVALGNLTVADRNLLTRRYRNGDTLEVMAAADGVAASSMHARLNRVVKRLQRCLGGASPYRALAEDVTK